MPGEKPLLVITAQNMAAHADKLSAGTQALLKKFPDTFSVRVYPTYRTAAAPQWVYDATAKNATQCRSEDEVMTLHGCYGGVPFPIPQTGLEVIWNWLMRVEPDAWEMGSKNIVLTADGSRVLASRMDLAYQAPYYYKEGNAEQWTSKEYVVVRSNTTAPNYKVGEALVLRDAAKASDSRQAWQYLVGQRRVRKAPSVGYDTPDFVASGANYFDEVKGFMGHPDRYQWKLVGKRELYIPYNTNSLLGSTVDEAFGSRHLNPEKLRWELHRVWEVEATLLPGKRHVMPKRRFYLDEDTWHAVLTDGYDKQGSLWHTGQAFNFVMPSLPGVLTMPNVVYDLTAGTMSSIQMLNEELYRLVKRKPDAYFTGDAMASEGNR